MTESTRVALVLPIPKLVGSFAACVAVVAEERRYLGLVHGRSEGETREFIESVWSDGGQVMLAIDGDLVVGWCSTIPQTSEGFTHLAHIGMGILPEYRGQGLGRRLIDNALGWAWNAEYERLELSVFTDNEVAVHLYRSVGFVEEGVRRRARKLDGQYKDITFMAIFRPDLEQNPPSA